MADRSSTRTPAPRRGAKSNIGDDAVRRATGHGWVEWFRLLDHAGAERMAHRDIAMMLWHERGLNPWWCQMVTVEYERARGMRDRLQRPDGYEVSRARTLEAPTERLVARVRSAMGRRGWCPTGLVVRASASRHTLRFTGADGRSIVEFRFLARGKDQCQITVQHGRLPDAQTAACMGTTWSEALSRLAALMSPVSPRPKQATRGRSPAPARPRGKPAEAPSRGAVSPRTARDRPGRAPRRA